MFKISKSDHRYKVEKQFLGIIADFIDLAVAIYNLNKIS
jgi:hypothetical protein